MFDIVPRDGGGGGSGVEVKGPLACTTIIEKQDKHETIWMHCFRVQTRLKLRSLLTMRKFRYGLTTIITLYNRLLLLYLRVCY